MNRRILNFEHNGESVLGFDTGLNAQAFAQAKMAQFITHSGYIVLPDGRVETWLPGGVIESGGTMIIWGPSFPDQRLTDLINDSNRKDEALNALRYWLTARMLLEEKLDGETTPPFPGPSGAFVISNRVPGPYPLGTVFFPPARLLKRSLEAEGDEAVRGAGYWVHPDLEGSEGIAFSAGAMLYRIFCDTPPFQSEDQDILRQDIREGVFIPPALAAPGLDPELSELISASMCRKSQGGEPKTRPSPAAIGELIGPPAARQISSWIKPLSAEEITRILSEKEQFSKKKNIRVKTRRFIIRNTAIIVGALAAVIVLALIVRGQIKRKAELPTTKGMTPVEVAGAYYGAFDELDHTMMDACVTGKAGKNDIEMVINFFVTSRMRQAYEYTDSIFMTAREWIDAGRPVTDKIVFGITDLSLKPLSERNGEARIEAEYLLWIPGAYLREDDDGLSPEELAEQQGEIVPPQPGSVVTRDLLDLTLKKDAWHISAIDRTSQGER